MAVTKIAMKYTKHLFIPSFQYLNIRISFKKTRGEKEREKRRPLLRVEAGSEKVIPTIFIYSE